MHVLKRVAAAAGVLLFMISCGPPPEPKIGAVIPESGAAGIYGKSVRAGMDLALAEVNADGGVDGKPVDLIYADSGGTPETGVAAAEKLITEHNVPIIIGAVSSSVTMQILDDVADPKRVPLLSPASSSPGLTARSTYFSRVYPSDALEGSRMADLISSELRLRSIVVFAVIDEYGSGYKKPFIERYRKGGKTRDVLKVYNFMPGTRDFAAQIEETGTLAPESIFLVGYMDDLAPLIQQIRAAGITTPIFTSGSITAAFPEMAGDAAEGVVFSRASFRMVGNQDEIEKFLYDFTDKNGHEPDDYAAYGYDAVKMVALVMRNVVAAGETLTAENVHRHLRSDTAEYHGVTGTIVFGNAGDVVASPTTFIISNGELILYKDYLDSGGTPPGSSG